MNNPINPKYSDPEQLNESYTTNKPFSHVVLDNFIDEKLLKGILDEFPDLSKIKSRVEHKNSREQNSFQGVFQISLPRHLN
jgi:hypothetical protein